MTTTARVRTGLLLLLAPSLVTGLHAVLAPRSWYDDFTGGIAPPSAFGAYNEHFVQDLGGGYLAVAAAILFALMHLRVEVVRCAVAAFVVFNVPHLVIHLVERGDLDDRGYLFTTVGLGFGVLVALWVWAAAGRLDRQT